MVTPDAILYRINQLNRGKAQGPDEIPPRVIYELGRELSVPPSILFNKSLELGKIPLEEEEEYSLLATQKALD